MIIETYEGPFETKFRRRKSLRRWALRGTWLGRRSLNFLTDIQKSHQMDQPVSLALFQRAPFRTAYSTITFDNRKHPLRPFSSLSSRHESCNFNCTRSTFEPDAHARRETLALRRRFVLAMQGSKEQLDVGLRFIGHQGALCFGFVQYELLKSIRYGLKER